MVLGCVASKYPIDSVPKLKIDSRLIGDWKIKDSDTNERFSLSRASDNEYLIMYKDSKFETQQPFYGYLSEVNKALFLNGYRGEDTTMGYLLLKIININADATEITATNVIDTTLKYARSSQVIRKRVEKNLNNRSFYGSPSAVFYKVN